MPTKLKIASFLTRLPSEASAAWLAEGVNTGLNSVEPGIMMRIDGKFLCSSVWKNMGFTLKEALRGWSQVSNTARWTLTS